MMYVFDIILVVIEQLYLELMRKLFLIFFIFLLFNSAKASVNIAGLILADNAEEETKNMIECEKGLQISCEKLEKFKEEMEDRIAGFESVGFREFYLKKYNLPKKVKMQCFRNPYFDDFFTIDMVKQKVFYEAIGNGNGVLTPKGKVINSNTIDFEQTSKKEIIELALANNTDSGLSLEFFSIDIKKNIFKLWRKRNIDQKTIDTVTMFGYYAKLLLNKDDVFNTHKCDKIK